MAKYLNEIELQNTLKDGDGNQKWFIVGKSSEWDGGTHLVSVKNFFTFAMPAVCRSCGEPIPDAWANSGWLYDHNYRWTCPNCGVLNKRGDAVGVYTAYGNSNTGNTRLLVEGALVEAIQNMDYTPKSQTGTTFERDPGVTPGVSTSCTINLINVSGTTSASFVGGNSNGWTIYKNSNTQYILRHPYDARNSHDISNYNDYLLAFPTTNVKFHATGVVNDLTVPVSIKPFGRGVGYTTDGSYLMKFWFHGAIYISPNAAGLQRFCDYTGMRYFLENSYIPEVPFPGSDVYNGNIVILWSFTSLNISTATLNSAFEILYVSVLDCKTTDATKYYGMYNNPNWAERSSGFNAQFAPIPASATTSNPYARFNGIQILINTSYLDSIPSWRNNGYAAVVFRFGYDWTYPGTLLHSYPTFLLRRTSVDYFGYSASDPTNHYTWFY